MEWSGTSFRGYIARCAALYNLAGSIMIPEALVSTETLLFLSSATLYIVFCAAYYGYYSPLARIPSAHPTSAFSSLWILWTRYRGSVEEISAVTAAHDRHGPVVRLGPREISLRSNPRRMLGSRVEKPDWYSAFTNFRRVLLSVSFVYFSAANKDSTVRRTACQVSTQSHTGVAVI
jgi:hypothetical protein